MVIRFKYPGEQAYGPTYEWIVVSAWWRAEDDDYPSVKQPDVRQKVDARSLVEAVQIVCEANVEARAVKEQPSRWTWEVMSVEFAP